MEDLRREMAALKTTLGGQINGFNVGLDELKEALKAHQENTKTSLDKIETDLKYLMKEVDSNQTNIRNLGHNTQVEARKLRENLEDQLHRVVLDLADTRRDSLAASESNKKTLFGIVKDIAPLKEGHAMLFDKLKVVEAANLVHEWKEGHIPKTTAFMKDLTERVNKINLDLQGEMANTVALRKKVAAIQSHFKRFNDIASGLDNNPDVLEADSMRLPAISG